MTPDSSALDANKKVAALDSSALNANKKVAAFKEKSPPLDDVNVNPPLACVSFEQANYPIGSRLNPIACDTIDTNQKAVTSPTSVSAVVGCSTTPPNPYAPCAASTTQVRPTTVVTREEFERLHRFFLEQHEATNNLTRRVIANDQLTREQMECANFNRRRAFDIQRRNAYQQLTNNMDPDGVPNRIHREHTYILLRLLKNLMDWNDEQSQNDRHH